MSFAETLIEAREQRGGGRVAECGRKHSETAAPEDLREPDDRRARMPAKREEHYYSRGKREVVAQPRGDSRSVEDFSMNRVAPKPRERGAATFIMMHADLSRIAITSS